VQTLPAMAMLAVRQAGEISGPTEGPFERFCCGMCQKASRPRLLVDEIDAVARG
jgi:hypothetical protein